MSRLNPNLDTETLLYNEILRRLTTIPLKVPPILQEPSQQVDTFPCVYVVPCGENYTREDDSKPYTVEKDIPIVYYVNGVTEATVHKVLKTAKENIFAAIEIDTDISTNHCGISQPLALYYHRTASNPQFIAGKTTNTAYIEILYTVAFVQSAYNQRNQISEY
jgi:hypothetical protein